MKIYYIQYRTVECGELETFGSKREAEKRLREIKREIAQYEKEAKAYYQDSDGDPYDDKRPSKTYETGPEYLEVDFIDFPISKQGIVDAMSYGADIVEK